MKKKKNNYDKKSFMITNETNTHNHNTESSYEYPIKDFVLLKGYQNDRKINIATYKYPARDGTAKGVVYIV
jgi:hypothetical protein